MLFLIRLLQWYSLCKNNMSVSLFPPSHTKYTDGWKMKCNSNFIHPSTSDEYVSNPRCFIFAAVAPHAFGFNANLSTTAAVWGEMSTGAEINLDYEKCAYLYEHGLDSLASLYYTNCWIYKESQLPEYIHLICKITTATLNKSLQKRKIHFTAPHQSSPSGERTRMEWWRSQSAISVIDLIIKAHHQVKKK